MYLLFLFSGSINYLSNIPYRTAYVSLLPLIIMPFYKIKVINNVTKSLLLLLLIILISAALNNTQPAKVLLYLRYVYVPFSMYYLTDIYLNSKNIERVIKACVIIGIIQFPVVLIQKTFGNILLPYSTSSISLVDFYFGTFPWSSDVSMSFFLILLILYLLFDHTSDRIVNKKMLCVCIYSITILLSGSDILRFILLFIWVIFIIVTVFQRKGGKTLLIISFIIVIFAVPFLSDKIQNTALVGYYKLSGFDNVSDKEFMQFTYGRYSRKAAVLYFLEQPLSFFGDGPSTYVDPINRNNIIGISGQFLTFYAEIGILGLIISYLVLYSMILRSKYKYYSKPHPYMNYAYFIVISIISLTHCILSDVTIMLIYNIFLKTHLIDLLQNKSKSDKF